MSRKFRTQNIWVVLLMGVIIGLIIAVGFQWTQHSSAQLPMTSEKPVVSPQPASDLSIADQLSTIFASVAAQVNPSVVTIFTETTIKMKGQPFSGSPFDNFFGDDFFKKFFQMPNQQGDFKKRGLGSGVVVDQDGILLTNNHVVDDADNIKVLLMDGREFEAKVKGRDPQTDLAVITIDAQDLKPIKIGDSDKARVGEWVLAIGSPLNPQLEHTVTAGIVSAKGRSGVGLTQYEDYIQTDAAINPGNSGGALVNLRGELIGINSAIATQTGGNMGIGFAIPANLTKKVMTDIITKGKVERGWLGVYIQNITPEIAKAMKLGTPKGVLISKVQDDSPAKKAGLKEEDVIMQLNGKDVNNTVELSTWIAGTSPGKKVTLKVLRDGKPMEITVKLEELNPKARQIAQGKSNYEKIGLLVSNITPELRQKYQLSKNLKGVVITTVKPGRIAAEAGLREGDVILKLNRHEVGSVEKMDKVMNKVKPGDNLLFYIKRGDGNLFLAFSMPGK